MNKKRISWLVLVLAILAVATFSDAQISKITPIADITVTGTATQIASDNGNRHAVSCTNNGTVNVRWGNSSVTATTGQRLAAGASIEIRASAVIFMISEGANVTVSCTEEAR